MSKTRDNLLMVLVHKYAFVLEWPFGGLSGDRKWRWDAAQLSRLVAVEYSGFGPGHQWNKGVTRDYEKITEGQLCGWTVVVCNSEIVNSGKCLEYVERALEVGGDASAVPVHEVRRGDGLHEDGEAGQQKHLPQLPESGGARRRDNQT